MGEPVALATSIGITGKEAQLAMSICLVLAVTAFTIGATSNLFFALTAGCFATGILCLLGMLPTWVLIFPMGINTVYLIVGTRHRHTAPTTGLVRPEVNVEVEEPGRVTGAGGIDPEFSAAMLQQLNCFDPLTKDEK